MKDRKLMIFIEGTTFNTKICAMNFTPKNYVPINKAVETINKFSEDYKIIMCTFRKRNIKMVKDALDYYKVKYDILEYRRRGESYANVVERVLPDIIIEDDCQSIGGEKELCIYGVNEEIKNKIKSIIVPEYTGIDEIQL